MGFFSYMSAPVSNSSSAPVLAQRLGKQFGQLPQVEAVALGGSRASEVSDARSDIDLYVYHREPISVEFRRQIASPARHAEIGNEFWEPGDEWIDAETGISVDVMFRQVRWIEDRLDSVLKRHVAAIGYSTCFCYNVLHSQVLFDRTGWFAELQKTAEQPYPLELKRAIIAKNYPILRRNMSSYVHQIELAIERKDFFSVHHRTTALLASYFDILFALNEQLHPGEKRLVQRALQTCQKLPENFPQSVDELLALLPRRDQQILGRVSALLDGLEALLKQEELLPEAGDRRIQN
jgi:hypothetical protein